MFPLSLNKEAFWIGAPEDYFPESKIISKIQTVYFKTNFHIDTSAILTAFITAHSRYKLWVNGQYVTSGSCKSDQYHRFCEKLELTPYLKTGENVITVKVVAYPPREASYGEQKGPDWSVNKACGACLLFSGQLLSDEGYEIADLSTGNYTWLCSMSKELTPRLDYISMWMGSMEIIDGAETLPDEERDTSLLTDRWKPVQRKWPTSASPFGILPVFELYERPIPLLLQEVGYFVKQIPVCLPEQQTAIEFKQLSSMSETVTVLPHTTAVLELDAGKMKTGLFRLRCIDGSDSTIKILYSESYYLPVVRDGNTRYIKGIRDDYISGTLQGHYDLYKPGDGFQQYEPFLFRTFRFVHIEITTGSNPLKLYVPYYVETRYPLEQKTKLDNQNEKWIQDVWEISLATLQNCMHETYEDCPYYEQMQYTMDTRLQILYTYCLSNDFRMAEKTIYEYHSSLLPNGMLQSRYPCNDPQVIPPFALHWIFMVQDYYWYTGKQEIIERYRPTMEAVLGYYRRKKIDGLVQDLGYWEMIDWTDAWQNNYGSPTACNHGPSTIHNFVYAYALNITSNMMQTIGLTELAARYQTESDAIQDILYERCYDEERGLYREGPEDHDFSQHAQVWAVLCGVKDAQFRKNLMMNVHLNKDLIPCSFPLQFYLFRAFEQTGLYMMTEQLWDLWKKLIPLHLTTIPEEPKNARSDCHAWGALMLYEYPSKILGVCCESAGYESIAVRPVAWYVKQASGVVSTPAGNVSVAYHIKDNQFNITVENKTQKQCTLYLPDGEQRKIEPDHICNSSCVMPQ